MFSKSLQQRRKEKFDQEILDQKIQASQLRLIHFLF